MSYLFKSRVRKTGLNDKERRNMSIRWRTDGRLLCAAMTEPLRKIANEKSNISLSRNEVFCKSVVDVLLSLVQSTGGARWH